MFLTLQAPSLTLQESSLTLQGSRLALQPHSLKLQGRRITLQDRWLTLVSRRPTLRRAALGVQARRLERQGRRPKYLSSLASVGGFRPEARLPVLNRRGSTERPASGRGVPKFRLAVAPKDEDQVARRLEVVHYMLAKTVSIIDTVRARRLRSQVSDY